MSMDRLRISEIAFKRGIRKILVFAESIEGRYQIKEFSNDVQNIRHLYQMQLFVSSGDVVYKNYTDNDILCLQKFMKRIMTNDQFLNQYFISDKKMQLHQLWNLLTNLLSDKSISDIILFSTSGIQDSERMDKEILHREIMNSPIYNDLIQRNKLALLDCMKDIHEIINLFQRNRIILKTLFSVLVSNRETHHATLLKILKEAKRRSGLPYDIEEICSVNKKVSRGNDWVTDIIAIRNCIGHAKFEIDENLTINFKNNAFGYNFDQTFTFEEFLCFFQDYYRLQIIQQKSLSILNLMQRLQFGK